jgi:hypothetical protein
MNKHYLSYLCVKQEFAERSLDSNSFLLRVGARLTRKIGFRGHKMQLSKRIGNFQRLPNDLADKIAFIFRGEFEAFQIHDLHSSFLLEMNSYNTNE